MKLSQQLGIEATASRGVVKVPLEIDARSGDCSTARPMSVGVPLPRQAVREPVAAVLHSEWRDDVPVQVEPLVYWPDGSVQWLSAEFLLPPAAATTDRCTLELISEARGRVVQPTLRLQGAADRRIVATGTHCFGICTNELQPFCEVSQADGSRATSFASELLFTDRSGHVHRPTLDEWRVESAGPVRLTIAMEGRFPRVQGLRLTLRASFFAGTGLVRLDVTLHNPRRARHKGGLWDLGDSGSVLFEEFAFHVALPDGPRRALAWSTESDAPCNLSTDTHFRLYQDSSGGESWDSPNHVNRHGRVPCRFRGYELSVGDRQMKGNRASPTVCLETEHASLTVAVPDFWQQFPKAVTVDSDQLRIGLFPREFDDQFELQGGERKTHTIWLRFDNSLTGSATEKCQSMEWVHRPLVARVPADWCDTTGALQTLAAPAGTSKNKLQALLSEGLHGPRSIPARREKVDEFGWRNYGDVFADHEQLHYEGARPLVSHYNNQFDMLLGFLTHFLRTGDPSWWELGDALARHVADIDIYHTSEDRAAYNGGLFWFTDHYLHAHTSTHRTYSRHNRRSWRQHYGGGPSAEHNFTTGLLLHYCLTGNSNSRDAIVTLADWVIAMDDGRRTILGVIDVGPTGLASGTNGVLGRAAGNSINALLDAWTVTRSKTYLDYAETLIQRCIHPNDDIGARELLHVEKCWSYTVFLKSLSKYLDLKADARQVDTMYRYAQASFVHYAHWMLENEKPYFDQAEKLEFPTEAWAAQEFRKANVLRLAARHVDEPWRTRFYDRGDELADRAWADLLRFDSRASARALAIVMVEGLLDCTLRSRDTTTAPQSKFCQDLPGPTQFDPQRARVKKLLQSPRGVARLASRLANPGRWIRSDRFVAGNGAANHVADNGAAAD